MAFSIFKEYTKYPLSNPEHHHYLILEHFFIPSKQPRPVSNHVSLPHPFALWQLITHFLSLWICLLWRHHINENKIFGLLCLASFTYHTVFKVHLCCGVYGYFILFYVK